MAVVDSSQIQGILETHRATQEKETQPTKLSRQTTQNKKPTETEGLNRQN